MVMGKKDQERSTGRHMFVEQLKSLTEISKLLNVSINTLSKWANDDGWKAARDAKLNGNDQAIRDTKQVLSDLAEQRISLNALQKEATEKKDFERLQELNRQAAALSDESSKWNKNLQMLQGPKNVSLAAYLDIMDDIFNSLRAFDQKLYLKTLDFQEQHIRATSKKLG